MKKLIAVLLSLFLLLSVIPFVSFAENALIFDADDISAEPGDSVSVSVRIASNPGFAYLRLRIDCGSAISCINVENKASDLAMGKGNNLVSWDNSENYTGTGILCVFTFLIPDDAKEGIYSISMIGEECYSEETSVVSVQNMQLQIAVKEKKSVITSAQIALGTDITVNYYANLSAAHSGAKMRFTMNGKVRMVDGVKNGNETVFPFTGVSPQCMGDRIKAELMLGETVLDTIEGYSVRQGCLNLLSQTADDLEISSEKYAAMKTLIADLLEYGARAQIYRNYKTDALVNAGIAGQSTFVPLLSADWEKELTDGSARENTEMIAAGVFFDYVNRLYVKFTAPGITETNFYVQVTDGKGNETKYSLPDFESSGENTYILYTDAIFATEFDDFFEIKLCDASNSKRVKTVQTLYYSVASYVFAKQNNNTAMADLAKATYNYGVSAVAYANAR